MCFPLHSISMLSHPHEDGLLAGHGGVRILSEDIHVDGHEPCDALALFFQDVASVLSVVFLDGPTEASQRRFRDRLSFVLRGVECILEVERPASEELDEYVIAHAVHTL